MYSSFMRFQNNSAFSQCLLKVLDAEKAVGRGFTQTVTFYNENKPYSEIIFRCRKKDP